jgi:ABC-type Mn2+/Zn2+ transport system permease subunit
MLTIVLSCIVLSLLFAPIGCALLWQRQAYFSDGLAHACLLAAALSTSLSLPLFITAPIIAAIFASLVMIAKDKLSSNSAINLVSSTMLSLGIIIASCYPGSVNLNGLLLGDILSITQNDLIALAAICLVTSSLLFWKLDVIILTALNTDLAKVSGVNTKALEFIFLVMVAVSLAACMKIVGALLSSAMLLIPAAASYHISRRPVQMIAFSILISIIASMAGLCCSFYFDLPTAPCIILGSSALYLMARWAR